MSAFVCGPDHFKVLAIFAASRTGGYGSAHWRDDPRYVQGVDPEGTYAARGIHNLTSTELANLYANVLYAENIRSVGHRYAEDTLESMPGLINKPNHIEISHNDTIRAIYRLKPVELLKMCDCLEYQSCETDGYRQTVAFELLDRIRGAAIKALAGYEDAPWDYCAEPVSTLT